MARKKPGTSCCVCVHPERTKIEALVVGGNSASAVAAQFGVDRSQLSRHMSGTPTAPAHVTAAEMSAYLCGLSQVEELRLIAARQSGTILEDLQLAKAMCFKQMHDAATVKDASRFASLSGRFLDILEALGQRTGEISRLNPAITVNNSTTVNITASPQFARLQRNLMKLVLDFPEVRGAVATMLQDCEAEERRGELVDMEAHRAA